MRSYFASVFTDHGMPYPRFEGSSGMGPRGDVIVEADWCIGELWIIQIRE